ncbi:MAG: LysR family transcriptional regulator [Burkholderiales bacterium]|nr:LysR family transcriptional regulator [Burkholderiales bacterium]
MPIRLPDLGLLQAFDVLMQERSVTRAAARLALTQPTVSGMLARLREAFGDPLFVRTPRGIAPTPRAESLAEPVRRILADVDRLLAPAVFEPAAAGFTLSLAATDYALRAVVQPFISALRPLAPGIRVAVRPIDEATLAQRMEHGELDLALLTPHGAPPDLHSRRLFDERYVCAMRRGHPAAAQGALSLEAFCALDHGVVSLQGGGFVGATDEALARLGRQRRVVVSVPSFLMLLELIHTSDLVALLPQRLLARDAGLHVTEPPLQVPGFTKILAWHARTHDDPGHRWLRELLVEVCRGV